MGGRYWEAVAAYAQSWLEKWRGCLSVARNIWHDHHHALLQRLQQLVQYCYPPLYRGCPCIYVSTRDVPYSKIANRCHNIDQYLNSSPTKHTQHSLYVCMYVCMHVCMYTHRPQVWDHCIALPLFHSSTSDLPKCAYISIHQ